MTDKPTLEQLAGELPRDVAPPPELWDDIRGNLAPRQAPRRPGLTWSTGRLLAAAVIVAVASSALTLLAVRERPNARPRVVTAPSAGLPAPVALKLPARLASAEDGYARSVEVLARTLAERRDSLAPSTVATVERSLRIADSAIAEARDALARDPANRALAELFASNYERKIDLLRRATELTPRT